ncbi:hypothetical protein [Limosilactobacillus albertensis]|uniref:Uncharacterized protein n=1 Tax=Limosilactobacillus albertensis TaxID=2759752 RepID=A0A839HAI3_9LACO|nr:hypothetical protein [Limosilactobacillus albertensis]MBB1122792.1 hypothetical protein [Limosilactobacillus albertensis]MCD7122564.1 hypothetical protein [Limosilactobacillus albertensis]
MKIQDQINYVNNSLSIIKSKVKAVFGVNLNIDEINLSAPTKHNSFYSSYVIDAEQEVARVVDRLTDQLQRQNIIKNVDTLDDWDDAKRFLDFVVDKLQKY